MKKLLISIVMFPFALQTFAQNEYRVGDNLTVRQIGYAPFPSVVGKGLVWDFSDREVAAKELLLQYLANRDTTVSASIASFDQRTKCLYASQGDSLLIKGFQNKQVFVRYDEAELDLRLPLCLGDEEAGCFSARGSDVLGNAVQILGNYKYEVIGEGTLITTEGDTLTHALLVHNERMVASSFESLEARSMCGLPVMSHAKIDSIMAMDTTKVRDDIYRWYVPGYRYPILRQESISTSDGKKVLYTSCLYCSVSSQSYLASDIDNERVRRELQEKEERRGLRLLRERDAESPLLDDAYSLSWDAHPSYLSLAYELALDADVAYGIYTQEGMVLRYKELGRQAKGVCHVTVDVGGLGVGNRIFTLFVNGKPYSKAIK